MTDREFTAARYFLFGGFAERVIIEYGIEGHDFDEALDTTMDFFPAISRGEISVEAQIALGLSLNDKVIIDAVDAADFVGRVTSNPRLLVITETSELLSAFRKGLNAGVAAAAANSPLAMKAYSVNYRRLIAEFCASVLFDESDEAGRNPLAALSNRIEELYRQVFDINKGRYEAQAAYISEACKTFWNHFGVILNERLIPYTWW